MSFYTGNRQENTPGPIRGNPLNGLCEKACIQVKKVFDACLKQQHLEDFHLKLCHQKPAHPTAPLTFVSAQSSTTKPVTITNVTVTRFEERPNFARVTATVHIPLDVVYVDANHVEGMAEGTIVLDQDVILFVPQPSIIPFTIEPVASAVAPQGEFINCDTVNLECCVMLILKVVAETELLVPTYGYCHIPPCQDFAQDVCAGFFEMPLFPTASGVGTLPNL